MPASCEPTITTAMTHIHAWWQERQQEDWDGQVLAVLDAISLDTIAARHGLSRSSLVAMAESDPSACCEMIQMMRLLDIDPEEAAGEAAFEEMAANCAHCPDKGRCRAHLAEKTALPPLDEFCENAAALNAMRATPHLVNHA